MADLGDFTITMETPPVIECVVETITQVQVVAVGEPGPAGPPGADGQAGEPGQQGEQGPPGSFSGSSSDDLPEGSTNRYYTSAREAAKQDVPIRVTLGADSPAYNGTGNNYSPGNYPGLDLVFTATGRYRIRAMINVLLTTTGTTAAIRFETSAGLVIGGNTSDPMGLNGNNSGNSQAILTTGSPTIISGPSRGSSTVANSLSTELIINVTTIGTLRSNLVFSGAVTGIGCVKAGSYIEARQL